MFGGEILASRPVKSLRRLKGDRYAAGFETSRGRVTCLLLRSLISCAESILILAAPTATGTSTGRIKQGLYLLSLGEQRHMRTTLSPK